MYRYRAMMMWYLVAVLRFVLDEVYASPRKHDACEQFSGKHQGIQIDRSLIIYHLSSSPNNISDIWAFVGLELSTAFSQEKLYRSKVLFVQVEVFFELFPRESFEMWPCLHRLHPSCTKTTAVEV